MSKCKLCTEKDTEIRRILKSYRADKKYYRYAIIGLAVLEVLTLAFGKEGVKMLFNAIKDKL